ncbi:MAG: ECF-type sigma factor [Phycisphaerales bacterium]
MTTASGSTNGDDGSTGSPATPELLKLAYATLHNLAAGYLRNERIGHTLQPTALVHEAFLKLEASEQEQHWKSVTHFQAVAATVMRQILVDHARARKTQKRGGDWLRVTMTPDVSIDDSDSLNLLALDEALHELEQHDARKCRVVELRFFGGLTSAEAAQHLGIATKTADADWYFARAWLRKRLEAAQ